jgi:hypothetical protein
VVAVLVAGLAQASALASGSTTTPELNRPSQLERASVASDSAEADDA